MGTMGSCLSPFIADIFMKTFETNLQSSPLFPKLWLRYVDDIFVIIERSKVNETLNWLNDQHPKIKFTMEEENNGRLPFLDVMVERQNNHLSFDVYRKPTSTDRYITADSFHPQSHKDAAFHSMAHRLCNFQLSEENYVREKGRIVEIGRMNGYDPQRINKIIEKHEKVQHRQSLTTLDSSSKLDQRKRISVPFYPANNQQTQASFQTQQHRSCYFECRFQTKKQLLDNKRCPNTIAEIWNL
jgi:hypothetical protein